MNAKQTKTHGFSLVEVMIGVTMIIVVLAGALVALKSFSKGSNNIQMKNYADQAINAVYEQIRYEASYKFDQMGETSQERPNPHWPKILVHSTIGAIDSVTRARPVTLTASWRDAAGGTNSDGSRSTKTANFTVTYTRAKLSGGIVTFRVEDTSGNPLDDVQVTVKAQDESNVTGWSVNGNVSIGSVYTDSAGLQATINGERAFSSADPDQKGYFFLNGEYGATRNGYTTKVQTPATEPARVSAYPNVIRLRAPGKITGRITDKANNDPSTNGLEAIRVVISPKTGTDAPLFTRSIPNPETFTDANGNYFFGNLIPGKYAVFVVGNSVYAALAKPGDANDSNVVDINAEPPMPRREYITVTSANTATKNYATIKKGSLSGDITGVRLSGANYVVGADPTSAVHLVLFPTYNSQSRYGALSFAYNSSRAWNILAPSDPGYAAVVSASDGQFAAANFTPKVLNIEKQLDQVTLRYPLDQQFIPVRVRPEERVPFPFAPVIVGSNLPATPAATQAIIRANGHYEKAVPAGSSIDMANVTVTANATANYQVRLLERTAFANIAGRLRNASDTADFSPSGLAESYVYTNWNANGYGGLVVEGDGRARIEVHYNRSAGTSLYTMSPPGTDGSAANPYRLPPNFGADVTTVWYTGRTPYIVEQKDFLGTVIAKEKVKIGTDIVVQNVSPVSISLPLWEVYGGWGNSPTNVNVTGTGGVNTFAETRPGRRVVRYWGNSGDIALAPGQSVPGTDDNSKILVQSESQQWQMTFQVSPNNEWQPVNQPFYFNYDTADNKYKGTITVNRIGHTGKIFGRVRDAAGEPVYGVTVRLRTNAGVTQTMTTRANACATIGGCTALIGGDSNMQFAFNNVQFAATTDKENMWLSVQTETTSSYMSVSEGEGAECYEGVNWQKDLGMSLRTQMGNL